MSSRILHLVCCLIILLGFHSVNAQVSTATLNGIVSAAGAPAPTQHISYSIEGEPALTATSTGLPKATHSSGSDTYPLSGGNSQSRKQESTWPQHISCRRHKRGRDPSCRRDHCSRHPHAQKARPDSREGKEEEHHGHGIRRRVQSQSATDRDQPCRQRDNRLLRHRKTATSRRCRHRTRRETSITIEHHHRRRGRSRPDQPESIATSATTEGSKRGRS